MARREWLTKTPATGSLHLSGGLHGDVGHALINAATTRRSRLLDGWQRHVRDRFYLELIRTGRAGEEECVQSSLATGERHEVAVVASNDVRFLEPDDFNAHEARVCIHDGRGLADSDRPKIYSEQQYLRTPAEMAELFADVPAALENSSRSRVAATSTCNWATACCRPSRYRKGRPRRSFSKLKPQGPERAAGDRVRCERIPENEREAFSAPYFERLDTELGVIQSDGFSGLLSDRCRLHSLGT